MLVICAKKWKQQRYGEEILIRLLESVFFVEKVAIFVCLVKEIQTFGFEQSN